MKAPHLERGGEVPLHPGSSQFSDKLGKCSRLGFCPIMLVVVLYLSIFLTQIVVGEGEIGKG